MFRIYSQRGNPPFLKGNFSSDGGLDEAQVSVFIDSFFTVTA